MYMNFYRNCVHCFLPSKRSDIIFPQNSSAFSYDLYCFWIVVIWSFAYMVNYQHIRKQTILLLLKSSDTWCSPSHFSPPGFYCCTSPPVTGHHPQHSSQNSLQLLTFLLCTLSPRLLKNPDYQAIWFVHTCIKEHTG